MQSRVRWLLGALFLFSSAPRFLCAQAFTPDRVPPRKFEHYADRDLRKLAFSADGAKLQAIAEYELLTFDVATGKECSPRLPLSDVLGVFNSFRPMKLAGDGNISLWYGKEFHCLVGRVDVLQLQTRVIPSYFAFTSDLRRILHADSKALREYDATTGKLIGELGWTRKAPFRIAIAPDNSTLVAMHYDRATFDQIDVWDLDRGELLASFNDQPYFKNLPQAMFLHGSRDLWMWDQDAVRVLDLAHGRVLGSQTTKVILPYEAEYYMPNRQRFLRGDQDGRIYLHDVHTQGVCKNWKCPGVTCVAFSSDMRVLAVGTPDGRVLLFDLYETDTPNPQTRKRPLDQLWEDLAAEDGQLSFAAVCESIRRGDEAVEFIREHLPTQVPPHAGKLIQQLDDKEYQVREAALKGLQSEVSVLSALEQALQQTGSPEQAWRLRQLLATRYTFPLAGDQLRELRAVEVLEMVQSPDSLLLLRELARNEAPTRPAIESRAALARIRAFEQAAAASGSDCAGK